MRSICFSLVRLFGFFFLSIVHSAFIHVIISVCFFLLLCSPAAAVRGSSHNDRLFDRLNVNKLSKKSIIEHVKLRTEYNGNAHLVPCVGLAPSSLTSYAHIEYLSIDRSRLCYYVRNSTAYLISN